MSWLKRLFGPARSPGPPWPGMPAWGDASGWDRYWQKGNGGEDGLCELAILATLIGEVSAAARGRTRVLFVGNGLSPSPKRLAAAGFDVEALDLSPWATRRAAERPTEDAVRPWLRYAELEVPDLQVAGGNVHHVCGDLLDASVCPGPFDAIVAAFVLHGFDDARLEEAAARLFERTTPTGVIHVRTRYTQNPARVDAALARAGFDTQGPGRRRETGCTS